MSAFNENSVASNVVADAVEDGDDLCAFFRRTENTSLYEILQPRSEVGWGLAWTFAARNVHAAEKAGWMMRRIVDPITVSIRHACRVRLKWHLESDEMGTTSTTDVVVVTLFPARVQFVLLLENGSRIPDLPFIMTGGVSAVASALGFSISRSVL